MAPNGHVKISDLPENMKWLNKKLTGFSFSQNLLSILGNFELIN